MSLNQSLSHEGKIKKIVVTGGPCAGKTTGMASITQKVAQMGRNVLVVPEAATELINAGVVPGETVSYIDFQHLILQKQLAQEALYERAARFAMQKSESGQQNQLILHDRGLMDGIAYVDPDDFDQILYKNNLDRGKILQDTYDGILFLDSAAEGAEEFYTTENNTARKEKDPVAARVLNSKLKNYGYVGSEKVRFQHNKQHFDEKIDGGTQDVINMIGLPVPLEIEDKFAVKSIDKEYLKKLQSPLSHIEQFYMTSLPGTGIHRARKLVQGLFTGYFHTIKGPEKYSEKERKLTQQDYYQCELIKALDTERIIKNRQYFLHDDQYFSFDTFIYPRNSLQSGDIGLMEIEKTHADQEVRIPSWMEVTPVTDDRRYSNAVIAGYKKAG